MRSFLYKSSRKTSTDEGINVKRTDAKKQVWMKKSERLQIGEVDQIKEDGFNMTRKA